MNQNIIFDLFPVFCPPVKNGSSKLDHLTKLAQLGELLKSLVEDKEKFLTKHYVFIFSVYPQHTRTCIQVSK